MKHDGLIGSLRKLAHPPFTLTDQGLRAPLPGCVADLHKQPAQCQAGIEMRQHINPDQALASVGQGLRAFVMHVLPDPGQIQAGFDHLPSRFADHLAHRPTQDIVGVPTVMAGIGSVGKAAT